MEIVTLTRRSIGLYIRFCKELYRDHPIYRDILGPTLKKSLSGKAEICKSATLKPIMVMLDGRTVAVCTLAIVDRMSDTVQIAYFEAEKNQPQAIDLIIQAAREMAITHKARTILVGLNFHVNYGLGLLADSYDSPHSFGSSFNPPEYIDYFKKYCTKEISLHTYRKPLTGFTFKETALAQRITKRYTVRKVRFSCLKSEIELYSRLNNEIFKEHDYYFERRATEDLELFKDFRPFLREENLLFLELNKQVIGFLLWYPDFNQLMNVNETIGFKTIIKSTLLRNKIDTSKIVEIGVIPQYRNNGAVLALFLDYLKRVQGRFNFCESGWILDRNYASKAFCDRWKFDTYKSFKVFSIDV